MFIVGSDTPYRILLKPYRIQLYTFYVQGLNIFPPWFLSYLLYTVLKIDHAYR